MKHRNMGQIRIIEAFLAVFIVFSSLAISANLTVTNRSSDELDDLASIGLQALLWLDSNGNLGEYINNRNWTALRCSLNVLLPTSVSFNVTVYDVEMRQINNEIISNGNLNSQDVAFVKYICVSQNSVFKVYVVYMHLAVAK